MKKHILGSLAIFILPLISHAQAQLIVKNFTNFLGATVVPFLIVLAFLFFIINVIRYFIIGSTNEQGREKAKALAIYGILAFVLISGFWGLIALIGESVGTPNETQPIADYCPTAGCL